MADTDSKALEAFEAFMKTEAPSDYDASNGDAWYVWKACWAAALASRPAEVDDEGLQFLAWCRQHRKSWIQTWRRESLSAPSHTTNKEK